MNFLRLLVISLCLRAILPATAAGAPSVERTQRFHSSYLNVFVSVVHALVEKGYEIENADELLGVITTKWKEETIGFFSRRDIRLRINASILQHEDDVTEVGRSCIRSRPARDGHIRNGIRPCAPAVPSAPLRGARLFQGHE